MKRMMFIHCNKQNLHEFGHIEKYINVNNHTKPPTIQPVFCSTYPTQGFGELGVDSRGLGAQRNTLEVIVLYLSASPSVLCMYLSWWRKPENPEETPKYKENMQTPPTPGRGRNQTLNTL